MLTSLNDKDGKIIAYCEWRVVGQSGYDMENGRYIWINDLWVHKSVRHQGIVNEIIDIIMEKVPWAEYCYFQRKRYNNKIRIFTRSQMERRRMSNKKVEA